MPSFLELAGDEAPKKRKSFLDFAGEAPKEARQEPAADVRGGTFFEQSPATQASVLANVDRNGPPPTFNGQPIDAIAVTKPTAPAAPPAQYSDLPKPNAVYTEPKKPLLPESDAKPVLEAVGSTVGGLAGGVAGLGAGAYHVLSEPSRWGDPALLEEAKRVAGTRAEALKNWVTAGPVSPMGGRYVDAIANAAENLNALGPAGAEIAGVIRPAASVAKPGVRTVADAQRQFEESKAVKAPRVEPSFGAAAASPVTPVVSAAAEAMPGNPAWYKTPAVDNASPPLRQAIAEATKKGGLDHAAVARQLEADSLPVPLALTRGQASQDPVRLSNEQNVRAQQPAYAQRFNQQAQQLVQNGDAIRANVAPDVTSSNALEHGQALVDSYKTMDAKRQADIGAKYKALADANGGQLPVDGQAFVKAADEALSKQMKGRYVPPEVAADLEGIRAGQPMSFEQFENLRTNLAAEGRKAERAGDGNRAAAVHIIRTQLEALPLTGDAAGLKPLADAARQAARERFESIRTDPAYRAAVNDAAGLGDPSPLADKFVNSYVVKAPRANLIQMQRNLEADPLAKQTIASAAVQHLMKQAGADEGSAKFLQSGYNRALSNDIAPKADALFDEATAHHLQALGNVAKYTQAQPRGSYVNNSNTLVASAAKGALETVANVAVPGAQLGTKARSAAGWVKGRLDERQAVKKDLAPGAGIRLSDVGK